MLDEAIATYWFCERFHWTPEQVESQPRAMLRRLRMIGETVDEVHREAQEESARKARQGR